MKLPRHIILTIAASAIGSLILTVVLIGYMLSQDFYSRQSLNTRLANFGFSHPIPADQRWHIPDHAEAVYPQTIVGYEPQLFLCASPNGGYEIYFYANAEHAGEHYDVCVREISSKQAVEYSEDGKLLAKRPLSSAEAYWSSDNSRLPLQEAEPIRVLRGSNSFPYVVRVSITERDSGKLIASADYLVKGNRLK